MMVATKHSQSHFFCTRPVVSLISNSSSYAFKYLFPVHVVFRRFLENFLARNLTSAPGECHISYLSTITLYNVQMYMYISTNKL